MTLWLWILDLRRSNSDKWRSTVAGRSCSRTVSYPPSCRYVIPAAGPRYRVQGWDRGGPGIFASREEVVHSTDPSWLDYPFGHTAYLSSPAPSCCTLLNIAPSPTQTTEGSLACCTVYWWLVWDMVRITRWGMWLVGLGGLPCTGLLCVVTVLHSNHQSTTWDRRKQAQLLSLRLIILVCYCMGW